MWKITYMPAQVAANKVIVSAMRLMAERHSARVTKNRDEIIVPPDAIPTHQT